MIVDSTAWVRHEGLEDLIKERFTIKATRTNPHLLAPWQFTYDLWVYNINCKSP